MAVDGARERDTRDRGHRADCAGLQRLRSPQDAGGVYQTCLPVSRLSANIPPPFFGSTSVLRL